MHTVIVTGGAGFIGSNFVRHILTQYPDYKVVVLDALTYAGNLDNLADVWQDPRFSFVQGSINDAELVGQLAQNADAFVNFAAETHVDRSIVDPGAFLQTDVIGVWTLLEAARTHSHSRFLHVSTDEVYGSIDAGSFTESDALRPNSPYSASKAGGEMMVRAYHQTYGLPAIVTRGSNTFGPYHYPEKLIPLFITNLIDDLPVPVYGDGLQVRDWMYVLDHCRGIDIALHSGEPGEVYNVGGGNERTNKEVTHLLLTMLGKPETLLHYVTDRPGHDRRYSVDTAKIAALGFAPAAPFEQRLQETVDWYIAHPQWWRAIKDKQQEYKQFMQQWYAERR